MKISIKIIGKDREISASYTTLKNTISHLKIYGLKIFYNAYMFHPNKSSQDRANMNKLAAQWQTDAGLFKKNKKI